MRTSKGTPDDDPGPELLWLEDLGTRAIAGAVELVARLATLPLVVAAWVAALARGGASSSSGAGDRRLPGPGRGDRDDR